MRGQAKVLTDWSMSELVNASILPRPRYVRLSPGSDQIADTAAGLKPAQEETS
jgi:hypothetical protein